MRHFALKASASIAFATAAVAANAVDGTVTVNGTVSATTCTVQVNGSGASSTVTLPTVGVRALAGAGAVAGHTAFTIGVVGCTTSQPVIAPYFESAGSSGFSGSGRLTTSVAGVEVEILNSAGNPVNLNGAGTVASGLTGQNVPTVVFTGSNPTKAATANFMARYYSTAASVGAGAIAASLAYTITYP